MSVVRAVSYRKACEAFRHVARLRHAFDIAYWDFIVLTPAKSMDMRRQAMDVVQGRIEETVAGPEATAVLKAAFDEQAELNSVDTANLRCMHHEWAKLHGDVARLQRELWRVGGSCAMAWQRADQQWDWGTLSHYFQRVCDNRRQVGKALVVAHAPFVEAGAPVTPYDGLLKLTAPCLTTDQLHSMTGYLQSVLPTIDVPEAEAQSAAKYLSLDLENSSQDRAAAVSLAQKLFHVFGFDSSRLSVVVSESSMSTATTSVLVNHNDIRLVIDRRTKKVTALVDAVLRRIGVSACCPDPAAMMERFASEPGTLADSEQPVWSALPSGEVIEASCALLQSHIGHTPTFVDGVLAPLVLECFAGRSSLGDVSHQLKHAQAADASRDFCAIVARIALCVVEEELVSGTLTAREGEAKWARLVHGMSYDGRLRSGAVPLFRQNDFWREARLGATSVSFAGTVYAAQLMAVMRSELTDTAVDEAIRAGSLGAILQWQKEKMWTHGSISPLNPVHFYEYVRSHASLRMIAP